MGAEGELRIQSKKHWEIGREGMRGGENQVQSGEKKILQNEGEGEREVDPDLGFSDNWRTDKK